MTCPVRVFITCPPAPMQIQHKDGEKDVAMRQLLYSMLITEDQTAQKVRCALCYVLVHLTFKLSYFAFGVIGALPRAVYSV